MKEVPEIPTPRMMAAAWDLISAHKKDSGIRKLEPGLGASEIWRSMHRAFVAAESHHD